MTRSEQIRDLMLGFLTLGLQITLFRHLQIYGAEPDLVLVYLLWLATRKNRTEVILYTAMFGFFQDAMTDHWGLHMFSKTLLIFAFYNYLNRIAENRLIIWQIFLLVLISAFLHNLIFLGLSTFVELYSSSILIWSMLLIGSLYTATLGSFLYLVRTE